MPHERISLLLDLNALTEGVDIRVDPPAPINPRELPASDAVLETRRFNLHIAGHSPQIYELLYRLDDTSAPSQMGSFIGTENDYASAPVNYEGGDSQLLAWDMATNQGLFSAHR